MAEQSPAARVHALDVAVFEWVAARHAPALDRVLPALSESASYSRLWIGISAGLAFARLARAARGCRGDRGRRADVGAREHRDEADGATPATGISGTRHAASRPAEVVVVPVGTLGVGRCVHGSGRSRAARPVAATERPRRSGCVLARVHGCALSERRARGLAPREDRRGRHAPRVPPILGFAVSRSTRAERWLPGVRLARTYERAWLRPDLIAGLVLAAILVPQGMAYAELAGVPAVNGLYATIGCLVGYAIFGPSRVLVLGPDSSVSPLIFAAIVPLLAAGDAKTAVALAGMLALLVGLIEIGMGIGRLGFVADLLSSEVQVGYMNGLAITIIVGQLPKLFGFSTDATSFFAVRSRAFFENLDETKAAALAVGVGGARRAARAPSVHAQGARRARRRRRRDGRLGGASGSPTTSRPSARCRAGFPKPTLPWTSRRRRVAAPHRGGRYHARLAHRHDRDVVRVRGSPRRRSRSRPGDDRDRRREPRRRVPAGLRGVDERRRALRSPNSRAHESQLTGLVGAGTRRRPARLLALVARRPPAVGAGRRRDRGGAVAARSRCAPPLRVGPAQPRSCLSLDGIGRRDRARRAAGHRRRDRARGAAVLPAQLVAARRGPRPVEGLDGWHSIDVFEMRASEPDVVVYRWEAPLFFANAGAFRRQVRHLVHERRPGWSSCSARRSPTSTSPRPACSSSSIASSTPTASTWRSSRCAAACRTSSKQYGLFETLDRDHFYPSVERGARRDRRRTPR